MQYIPTRRGLQAFAVGGAWFFIVASLLHLAWVVAVKIEDPTGLVTLYQTTVGDEVYRAAGLAYEDLGGLVRALLQASIVIGAAVLTIVPWRRPRRLGHVVLLTWSAWWAGNLLWLAGLDGQVDSVIQATLLTALFGCTGYRAWRGWTPPSSARPRPPAPIEGATVTRVEAAIEILEDAGSNNSRLQRLITGTRRRAAAAFNPQRRAAMAGGARRTWSMLERGTASAARHTRSGFRRGVAYLREHGVLPAEA